MGQSWVVSFHMRIIHEEFCGRICTLFYPIYREMEQWCNKISTTDKHIYNCGKAIWTKTYIVFYHMHTGIVNPFIAHIIIIIPTIPCGIEQRVAHSISSTFINLLGRHSCVLSPRVISLRNVFHMFLSFAVHVVSDQV